MKIERILYPTDFSDTATQALGHALFLAENFEAELHMLHAVVLHDYDPASSTHHFPEPAEIFKRLFDIADSEMARLIEDYEAKTFAIKEVKRKGFAVSEVVLDYAREIDTDLIVLGTHGRRGPARLFLGSVAEEVVRVAACPVLTLRHQDEPRTIESLEKVLVPIDFSEHSKKALLYAKDLARTYGAHLQLLHTIEEPSFPYFYGPVGAFPVAKVLTDLQEKAVSALGDLAAKAAGPEVPFDISVRSGRAASEIVRFAKEEASDMIVIATHGLSGLERLMFGSTAEQVVRTAPCPVFTVRSYGKSLLSE
jgi:nucleotide-binding universal stress UspA family protein